MATPKIFVSSTYYDLRHVRDRLKSFIESFGYEPVLFEFGNVTFHPDDTLDESCYAEVRGCTIFILIVGGRYGSPASSESSRTWTQEDIYASITSKEYIAARERDIPIYIFVEKNVFAEFRTYKSNKENPDFKTAHVDHINVFRMLDEIMSQKRNNPVREFDRFDDISSWLRDQWAGLFADLLAKRSVNTALRDLTTQLTELTRITNTLKQYVDAVSEKRPLSQLQTSATDTDGSLNDVKIREFANEELIQFIIPNIRGASAKPANLYKLFESATSLEQFLMISKVTAQARVDLLAMKSAEQSFDEISLRYFDRNNDYPTHSRVD